MLHTVTGRARKCGPSAISAVTGIPTHTAAANIRAATGRRVINGTSLQELDLGLRRSGMRVEKTILHVHPPHWVLLPHLPTRAEDRVTYTLAGFLDTEPSGLWIIGTGRHWLAYEAGMVVDNGAWFSRTPVSWGRHSPKRP